MKRIRMLLLIFIVLNSSLFAQKRNLVTEGKVLEQNSLHPIEYATIALLDEDNQLITGGISKPDGSFSISYNQDKKLSSVRVSYIGYITNTIKEIESKGDVTNLGNIILIPDTKSLEGVEIRAEQSKTVYKLDKKVFNVGQDIVSQGGSAMDVLNNVPSVDVSLEGNISLRGNEGVQILINGKPSVMANSKSLGTITADMIEKVEVVTNPSAKYDAEGTSGIINIVLQKDNKEGINGSISVNGGTPETYSLGVSLNRRTEKLNLFTQIGVGKRSLPGKSKTSKIDKLQNAELQFNSIGEENKIENFINLILGADYHFNKSTAISISGHYGYEMEDHTNEIDYKTINNLETIESTRRKSDITATNPKWQFESNFSKEFNNDEDHNFTAGLTGSYFGKDKSSEINNFNILADELISKELLNDNFYEINYTAQTDYKQNISELLHYELGFKADLTNLYDDIQYFDQASDIWEINNDKSNQYDFKKNIYASYLLLAYDNDKLGIQLGSRYEYTFNNLQIQNGENSENQFGNFFPSIHASYKFTELFSLQAGYSKRIRRPHMWDLNPFPTYTDNQNIYIGNPELKPTLTNSWEITSINRYSKGSINGSLFYHNSTDVVSDISEITNDISTTRPMNIGVLNTLGAEFICKYEPVKWATVDLQANYYTYSRTGELNNESISIKNQNWSGRFTTKFKLPWQSDLEIRYRYESAFEDLQSTEQDQYYADIAVKKKFLKGKGVITFSAKDVFNSRKHYSVIDNENFYYSYERSRSGRIMVIGFSYGFGKGEAMQYGGHKMF